MIDSIHQFMFGTDASSEVSLLNYGVLIAPAATVAPELKHADDEFFVVYDMGGNTYGRGYIEISTLDDMVQCKDGLLTVEARDLFLETFEISLEDWLKQPPQNKIQDAFYFGADSIMSVEYGAVSKDEAIRIYLGKGEEEKEEPGVPILLVNDSWGTYIPYRFAKWVDRSALEPVGDYDPTEDLKIMKEGPLHEHYWDAFESFCQQCYIIIDGKKYDIEENGDLWAYEHDKPKPEGHGDN